MVTTKPSTTPGIAIEIKFICRSYPNIINGSVSSLLVSFEAFVAISNPTLPRKVAIPVATKYVELKSTKIGFHQLNVE